MRYLPLGIFQCFIHQGMSTSHLEDSYFWIIQWFLSPHGLLPFFFFLSWWKNFIYDVVLVFAMQQCESGIIMHVASFLSPSFVNTGLPDSIYMRINRWYLFVCF